MGRKLKYLNENIPKIQIVLYLEDIRRFFYLKQVLSSWDYAVLGQTTRKIGDWTFLLKYLSNHRVVQALFIHIEGDNQGKQDKKKSCTTFLPFSFTL